MEPDTVTFAACGWSLARPRAHGTSIALHGDAGTVLVDAGGDVAKQLARLDATSSLERVYLTHEHPDHLWGLPGLIHSLRFTSRERPLALVGPAPALARVRGALDALDVTCPFPLEWREIEDEAGSDDIAQWAPMDHSVATLGYRFGDVTVLGDTRPTEQVTDLAEGSSLLVHEATHTDADRCHASGHSTPADAGRAASRAGVATLGLIHIHPSLSAKRAVEEAGFPDTIAPEDGDQLRHTAEGWEQRSGVEDGTDTP